MQRWIIVLVLFLLILAGCGQPAPSQSTPQTPEASTPSEITFGPGSFDLPDPVAGLTELSGYRATLILSFDGTRDGQPDQWTRTYEMRTSQNPPARQLTIEGGEVALADQWMAEVGGVLYELNEQGGCIASLSPEGGLLSQRWEPASFLSGLIGAEEAGADTASGVPAKHYTFDQRALGQDGLTESTGEVWIADAGYVVKYVLTTQGGAKYFGEGIEGTLTHDYNLTEIDQPATADLPEDCPPGLIDAPIMSDAQDVERLPGVTLFRTPSSITDVIAFYQDKLPGMGWQPSGEPVVMEAFGVLELTQGDQQLSVIASSGDNGTAVRLVLGKVESTPAATITPTP
jgi:hypothetical protein